MKLKFLTGMISLLLLATTASAVTLEGACDIRFFGRSTLHNFDGQVTCQPFTLASEGDTKPGGKLKQPVVKVLVREMDTDNDGRDKKMHAMFEEEKYPEIQGLFGDLNSEYIIRQLQETGTTPKALEFDLKIREIIQRVHATTHDLLVSPEQASFMMTFSLSLESFQLKAPSVLGFIKVDDQVQVEVKVILQRQ